MKFRHHLVLFIFCLYNMSGAAQVLKDNYTGQPYFIKPFTEYEGSAYLFDEWMNAEVKMESGQRFSNVLINIDLHSNLALFKKNDSLFTFSESLEEFKIEKSGKIQYFKKGSLFGHRLPDLFVEVLSSNPVLIKKVDKNLIEFSEYGSAVKKQKFIAAKAYYALLKDEVTKIKLNKEFAKLIFDKNWVKIESFAQNNKVSFKTEEGWLY